MIKLDGILKTEMTRRKFLTNIGLAMVSLFGISAVIGVFTPPEAKKPTGGLPGYGDHDYGP
jgi:hypothetical protein